MPNRLFYTVKLTSSLLKEYKYDLNITFKDCLKSGLIVSLADSQILKSIRDVTGKQIDRVQLEQWYLERDKIKKKKNSKENRKRIKELQENIYNMMYISDYITVVMDNKKDYERMYQKGFYFNGKRYRRFSCSASQARVSTIAFVSEEIKDELKKRLDNGRKMDKPLAPSKYNAYFGLYSSAIKAVTKPRFCIIPDYLENRLVNVDYVIETDKDSDDIIEPRELEVEFNRFDGSGLISPEMAEKWAQDLKEDYIPCQFCIRYAFTKGMVNEFDFIQWCKEENNGNYKVKDIYGNIVDLRNIDVILTEGMAKLWDSWDSQEDYESNCQKNGIIFGVTKYSPKKDKIASTANYQFLQTLNLNDEMVNNVCLDTINYLQGISYENVYYSLLFLMGENSNTDSVLKFMESSDNYWLKSLILNHNLLNDKYSKEKIREFLIKKIEQACLGRLIVKGNFQCIVPDSYAFMEAMFGKEVKGLLKEGEFYSQFWNNQGVDKVDCMRSPLTHFSEHYVVDLKNDEKMKKWFKYSYSGIITNTHDAHTMHFAGSDYDFDILFSTDNKDFINGVYQNQRVVTYNVKKPHKKIFTEDDLFKADTFSFGTRIGQITNICSTFVGMIPLFDQDSKEYKLLHDRVKMCCSAQSRQIDKTKIGEAVKSEATVWKKFQKITEEDTIEEAQKKSYYNSLLADKKPYFFRYKYRQLNKEINDYNKKNNENSIIKFNKELNVLIKQQKENEESLSEKEKEFLFYYHKFYPALDSDCVMNKICHHIEEVDFNLKKKIKNSDEFDWKILVSQNFQPEKKLVKSLLEVIEQEMELKHQDIRSLRSINPSLVRKNSITQKEEFDKENWNLILKEKLEEICSNEQKLTNHLVYLFYVEKTSLNKSVLWNLVGKQIYENLKEKNSTFYFPLKNKNGKIEFLYENYSIEKFILNSNEGN